MKQLTIVSTALTATLLLAAAMFILSHPPLPAAAETAAGSVTGQVVWNAPVPVPYGGSGQSQPGTAAPGQTGPAENTPDPGQLAPQVPQGAAPDTGLDGAPGATSGMPAPGITIWPGPRPYPRPIPAGAVLVAVQGTSLSARTDDQGRFRIDNVPVGQYLTVAAGPVRGVSAAVAVRPNVYIRDGGQTADLGRIQLGQSYAYSGPIPYAVAPGSTAVEPDNPQP